MFNHPIQDSIPICTMAVLEYGFVCKKLKQVLALQHNQAYIQSKYIQIHWDSYAQLVRSGTDIK